MPDKPLADVWATRDLPVLVEVTRRIDAGQRPLPVQAVADALGMSAEDVALAGQALKRRGFVETSGTAASYVRNFNDISGSAYLVTGLHPDGEDALSRLVNVLTQAAEQTSDPDERSRLRRAADGLVNLPTKVAEGVMTAYLTGLLPGQ